MNCKVEVRVRRTLVFAFLLLLGGRQATAQQTCRWTWSRLGAGVDPTVEALTVFNAEQNPLQFRSSPKAKT